MIVINGHRTVIGKIINSNFFIKSKNNLTSGGFTIGAPVTKDMNSALRNVNVAVFPGSVKPGVSTASCWLDWLDDIFDQWGFFYLYNYATDTYYDIIFSTINQADGVIATENFSAFGRNFTIKHGYPVQGIYKMDISVNDDLDFAFGTNGNMGSDNGTINENLTQNYTLNGEEFVLYYNYNRQNGSSSEHLYIYVVPYEKNKNKESATFVKGVASNDNLAIHTVSVKYGVTIYFAKRNDVKNWVINDLGIN